MRRTGRKGIWIAAVMLLWIAVLCALPSIKGSLGGSVYAALTRDDARPLTIRRLTEFDVPGSGWYLEGGTATPSGYVITFWKSTEKTNPVYLLDTNTWKVKKTSSESLDHANDMCYVPNKREIFVAPMDKKQFIALNPSTLKRSSLYYPPQAYHAVGYDTKSDRFAAVYTTGSGTSRKFYCDILDGTMLRKSSFSLKTNLTYQGLTVHDSLIYYTCWERGGTSKYEPVYDKVFRKDDNVIYVYNFSGKLVKTLLISCPEGYTKFELETASFIGNRMILQFNETKNNKNMVGIYEVTAEDLSPVEKAAAEKAAREKAEQEAREQAVARQMKPAKVKFTSVTKKKKAIRLKWKKVRVGKQRVSGYEVQICNNRSFTGDTLRTIISPGIKCTIKGLNRKTVYFVRVRAFQYVGTGRAFSAWSAIRKARTK